MRKRERDEVAAAARRRLDALSAELADVRPASAGWGADGPGEVTRAPRSPWSPGPADRGVPVSRGLDPSKPPGPRGPSGPSGSRRSRGGGPGRPVVPGGPGRPSPRPTEPRVPQPRVPEPRVPEPRVPPPSEPFPADPDDPDRPDPVRPGREHPGSFLDDPAPVLAGPPAGLLGERSVVHTPVGRPLPPDPARVPPPGRHVVDHPGPSVAEWVEDRLPAAVRGRLSLSGQHVKVLSGILGIALVMAGWLALRSGSEQEAVPQAKFVSQQAAATATPATPGSSSSPGAVPTVGAAGAGGSSGAVAGDVVVDVVGKVRRPGIVTLPTGSRVNDAVVKAGGLRPGAHTDALNLARVLVDGEQIVVGRVAAAATGAVPATGAISGATSGATSDTTPTTGGALVNLNTAGLSELDTLPGVGPVTAQKILDWRTAHGAFSSVDDLLEVDGIGDKTLADIAPRATL